jgi:hypothetical protein
MSHGFGPLVRMPAEAARRLSGALLFGPNRILVDKVMISAVAAGLCSLPLQYYLSEFSRICN